MSENLTIVDHPLVQHKLTLMRDAGASTALFRQLLREISQLLAYETTRGLALTAKSINTPIEPMDAPVLACADLDFAGRKRVAGWSSRIDPISTGWVCRPLPR